MDTFSPAILQPLVITLPMVIFSMCPNVATHLTGCGFSSQFSLYYYQQIVEGSEYL